MAPSDMHQRYDSRIGTPCDLRLLKMCGTKCPGITGPKAVKTLKGTRPVFSSEAVASAIRLLFTVIQAKDKLTCSQHTSLYASSTSSFCQWQAERHLGGVLSAQRNNNWQRK